ncbi:MAG: PQQ-binding-like beta-propeller repeat protein [Capsulimonadales bacterium]|nr:PQQ-binding-like beta-propeller repeat protein [Capsulimonadales bacterium]
MRTYVRGARPVVHRPGLRAVCISIAAVTALGIVAPLSGCGSGSGALRPVAGVTRAKGTVTMTVSWPARTRLIPEVANSIRITLERLPDTAIPTPRTVDPIVMNRPFTTDGSGTTTATFTNLELGTYRVVATAFPGTGTPGIPNPTTGENVPVATKEAGTVVVGAGNNTVTLTMDSTIAVLEPLLPDTFPRDTAGNLILAPSEAVQFDIVAYDAATAPRNRVLFTKSKLKYEVTQQNGANVTVNSTGLVQAVSLGNPRVPGSATIRVTDEESGKSSSIVINVVPAGLSRFAQWARFRGDSQNTGQVRDAGIPILDATGRSGAGQNWPFFTQSSIIFSSPVIAEDGTIYIGTVSKGNPPTGGDQTLFAINPDGSQKWRFDDAGNMGDIEGTPTIGQDGTVYIGSTNGIVYAIEDTGSAPRVKWTFNAGRAIYSSVALGQDNTLFVATGADANEKSDVYALSVVTGQKIKARQVDGTVKDWELSERVDGEILGSPALSRDGSFLFLTTMSGNVYAFRTGANGTLGGTRQWQTNPNGNGIQAAPVVTRIGATDVVVVATLNGRVFALRTDTGASTSGWPAQGYDSGEAQIYSTPTVREDDAGIAQFIYIATLDNSSGSFDHKVVGLNAADGTEVWRTPVGLFPEGFTSSPILSGDGTALYIGCFDGNVYAVDADPANANAEHGLVQVNVGGTLTDWIFPTVSPGQSNNLESSPTVDKQGHLYIGGLDGRVFSIGNNPAK